MFQWIKSKMNRSSENTQNSNQKPLPNPIFSTISSRLSKHTESVFQKKPILFENPLYNALRSRMSAQPNMSSVLYSDIENMTMLQTLSDLPPAPLPSLNKLDNTNFDTPSFLFVSGVGFLFVRVLGYPATLIKTRIQTTSIRTVSQVVPPGLAVSSTSAAYSANAKNLSSTQVLREIISAEGVGGLFRGLLLSLTLTMSRQFYFYLYEKIRADINRLNNELNLLDRAHLDKTRDSIAAFFASGIYQSVANPVDVIVQRLQIQRKAAFAASSTGANSEAAARALDAFAVPPAEPPKSAWYRWLLQKLPSLNLTRDLLKADGVQSLYRGFVSSTILFSISAAIWWGSFEYFLDEFSAVLPPTSNSGAPVFHVFDGWLSEPVSSMLHTHPWVAQHIAAGLSAGLSVLLTNPLDVCRTRLMTLCRRGDGLTASSVFKQLVKEEGWFNLMTKGIIPRSMSVIPTSILTMTVYQISKVLAVEVKVRKQV